VARWTQDTRALDQAGRSLGSRLVRAVLRPRRTIATPSRFDLLLVTVLIVLAEQEIWLPQNSFGHSLGPRLVEVIYTTMSATVLLARRRHPVATLAFVSALGVAKALIWVGSPGFGFALPMLVASYSVGRYDRGQHPWLVLFGSGGLIVITFLIHDARVPGVVPSGSLATFYVVALGMLPTGRALQIKDLRAELSEARARQLAIERDEAARRAVSDERSRIARELHDVVAHAASMIVLQAVAAQQMLEGEPDRARAPLEAIETMARQALEEMRRLLLFLHLDERPTIAALEPAPGIDALRTLVDRVVAAGQPVDLRIDGHQRSLSPGLDLAVYRVVQEALTNAVRHARGAATEVAVLLGGDHVELDIVNRAGASSDGGQGGGRGLVGMRERVRLYGGVFEAGPSPDGGFRIHARLPVGDAGR
jgi:signal transduction histidine kinase